MISVDLLAPSLEVFALEPTDENVQSTFRRIPPSTAVHLLIGVARVDAATEPYCIRAPVLHALLASLIFGAVMVMCIMTLVVCRHYYTTRRQSVSKTSHSQLWQ
jgi:hypothetical protein